MLSASLRQLRVPQSLLRSAASAHTSSIRASMAHLVSQQLATASLMYRIHAHHLQYHRPQYRTFSTTTTVGDAPAGNVVNSSDPMMTEPKRNELSESAATEPDSESSPPPPTSLPVALLIARLSDSRWNAKQLRTIILNILYAQRGVHQDTEIDQTRSSSSDVVWSSFKPTVDVDPSDSPLSLVAWECMMTATQQLNDLDTFRIVWKKMHETMQRVADKKRNTTKSDSAHDQLAKSQSSITFTPPSSMYLSYLTLLASHKQWKEVEPNFSQWKAIRATERKSILDEASTDSADSTDESSPSPSLSSTYTAIDLLSYHILLQSYAEAGTENVAKNALYVWREIKDISQALADSEMQQEEDEDASPQPSSSNKRASSFYPVHLTFHLILRSLLRHLTTSPPPTTTAAASSKAPVDSFSASRYVMQQLTPILNDMEFQYNLTPDSTTHHLTLQILHTIARNTIIKIESITTMTPQHQRQEYELIRTKVVAKMQSVWTDVHTMYQMQYEQDEADQDVDEADQDEYLRTIPPPLWFEHLDLCLLANQTADAVTTLTSMRAIGLLPSLDQCNRVLDMCSQLSRQDSPPLQPATMSADKYRLVLDEWKANEFKKQRVREHAADVALHMLKCIRTHQHQVEHPKSTTNLDGTTTEEATSSDDTSPVPPPISAITVTVASSFTLPQYLSAFSILSSSSRFDEFVYLWRHFCAQYQSLSKNEKEEMSQKVFDHLIQSAMRMEGGMTDEVEADESAAQAKEESESKHPNTSAAPSILAYNMIQFFSDSLSSPSASTSHSDSTSSPQQLSPSVLSHLSATTRILLLRSFLASNMTREFELVLEAIRMEETETTQTTTTPAKYKYNALPAAAAAVAPAKSSRLSTATATVRTLNKSTNVGPTGTRTQIE